MPCYRKRIRCNKPPFRKRYGLFSYVRLQRQNKTIKVIVERDLEYTDNADVLAAIKNSFSYGTAMETLIAKDKGKKVVSLAKDSVPTPWPIYISDFIVRDEQELFRLLSKIRQQNQ